MVSTSGTLTKLLSVGILVDEVDSSDSDQELVAAKPAEGVEEQKEPVKKKYKAGEMRPPTLQEVILDPEFLDELRGGNEALYKFLDYDKMFKMVDYLILEPGFHDSPTRCFQIPFTACEVFCSDAQPVMDALFVDEGNAEMS